MNDKDQVWCINIECAYTTQNDQPGNWGFECPECGQENIVFEEGK